MKFFNTAGPVNKEKHYKIDPLSRWDMEEILTLIDQEKYFILHAPRQTGKTSCMLALRDYLNKEGKYNCVYVNVEAAQTARNNIKSGISTIIAELHECAIDVMGSLIDFTEREIIGDIDANKALGRYLRKLCQVSDKPLILFIDEIDALIGDTLVSVLRQLRTGYEKRPSTFPQSVILCGVRDIKDYRIHRSNDDIITGGSCFNIKAKSLTLGNFSEYEVKKLFNEHTQETGQIFEPDIFPLLMHYTGGQPWLVNALGNELIHEMEENRDRSIVITSEMAEVAKERLIISRQTHLDQLVDKLTENRVRRVIEPIVVGKSTPINEHDIEYCIDLGLIKKTSGGLVISNGIYKEVIPRELTSSLQEAFLSMFKPEWIDESGYINVEKLITMFTKFWRKNSEIWAKDMKGYLEAAPHLTFFAFMQRVSNGHGKIDREYALGMQRADLYLQWHPPLRPIGKQYCGQTEEQRVIFELKLLTEYNSYQEIKADALEQTAAYADKCNATEAHILVFDRCGKTDWKEKIFTEVCEHNGQKIKIWGM